jgi:hypothetical protein
MDTFHRCVSVAADDYAASAAAAAAAAPFANDDYYADDNYSNCCYSAQTARFTCLNSDKQFKSRSMAVVGWLTA